MEVLKLSFSLTIVLAIALVVVIMPAAHAQISTPCTASMLGSFTPCMNLFTDSSFNGTAPTAGCCNSLRVLMVNGTDCLCLILTGNVPFHIPISRIVAISLPRACKMPGVPLQCKASGAPISAPGPVGLAPTVSPVAVPSASPEASAVPLPISPASAPESDSNTSPTLTPPSSTGTFDAPNQRTGSQPVLTPSAALPSHSLSTSLLLAVLGAGAIAFQY